MRKELIVDHNPKSALSESIKNIRTNLQFSSVDGKIKNILMTSSTSGEGKSFVSANLAVAFAKLGSKVLVVDCDMRLGRQHEIFGLTNTLGLSNLLIDDIEQKYGKYIQKTEIKNVSVLTRGIVPPNPSELLASEKMQQLMQILNNEYDIIIWDGVPIIGLPDSIIMAGLVDKIVLVCSCKKTPVELLQNAKNSLEKFSNKIAGVIVNRVAVRGSNYYTKKYL